MRKTVKDVSAETLQKHLVEVVGELLRRGNLREVKGITPYGYFEVVLIKKEVESGSSNS